MKRIKWSLGSHLQCVLNILYALLLLYVAIRVVSSIASNPETLVISAIGFVVLGAPIAIVAIIWHGFWGSLFK